VGVFHAHATYALMEHFSDPESIRMAALQLKALTVHVTLFFALAGMTSHALADKTLASVLSRSAMLLAVGALAHVVGVFLAYMVWKPWHSLYDFARDIGKPLVYGTEHTSFSWFFIVLAVVRLLAFAWLRHRAIFFAALALVAMVAAAPVRLPDNLYEWRYWPAAFALFMLGTRVPVGWRVPHWAGIMGTALGLTLPLVNHPTLLSDGLCLECHPQFILEPKLGSYGVPALFFFHVGASLFGLLWLAQQLVRTRAQPLLAYVGRHSLQLLVLHGWITWSVYALAGYVKLQSGGVALFVAVFVVNTALHLALYGVLRRPLDAAILLCSRLGRQAVTAAARARRMTRVVRQARL
jgi:hypothetical protein